MRTFLWFCGLLIFYGPTTAQQQQPDSSVFLETAGEGTLRFYFDEHYFLVDKHCAFQSIERVAGFDVKTKKLHGRFTDFNRQGHVLVEGEYVQGKKEGLFQAYHPSGALKWETRFADDHPEGSWKYYYPDGQLMMHLQFQDNQAKVITLRDRRGRQRVKEGKGTYDFKVPFLGYNPYGYPFVRHRGRLKEGLPDGFWQVFFQSQEGENELIAEEHYQNGLLKEGLDLIQDAPYQTVRYSILPPTAFLRGEALISKSCSYDDHVGFTVYLSSYLNSAFSGLTLPEEKPQTFQLTVQVDAQGQPSQWQVTESLGQDMDEALLRALGSIDYFIPSEKDQELISDKLTIQGELSPTEAGGFEFHSISIERAHGS